MVDVVAFNVGSSSVTATTRDGRSVSKTGVGPGNLGVAARAVAERIGVSDSTRHVHRVVHGGDMSSPKRLSSDVIERIRFLSRYATLHNPAQLKAIRALQDLTGEAGHAVFDTSFHKTIPSFRRRYGLPDAFHDAGIKQYGFHGISVRGAAGGRQDNCICCHLGSGCSVTAVHNGDSVATSMGLTPFDGCIMRTRPGRLDPGVVIELCRHRSAEDVDRFLNEGAGWTGMSNGESLKDLVKTGENEEIVRAFVNSVAEEIHRVSTALDTVDTLMFTGGAGENNATLRRAICDAATRLNIKVNSDRNRVGHGIISHPKSEVTAEVVRAREAETMLSMVDDA